MKADEVTVSKHTTVTRMDVPPSGGAVLVVVFWTALLFFVAVAISNLVDYASVPLFAIVLSVLFLLIVTISITVSIRDEHGLRLFMVNRMASIAAHHFVETTSLHGDDMVRFRFTLLGINFNQLEIRRAKLASVVWSSGQATSMAGHDMNDWNVVVWFNRKGSKRWISASEYREEDLHVVGPSGPKQEAAALGGSLVDFFRSAGIELHPTKNDCEFATRKHSTPLQDHI